LISFCKYCIIYSTLRKERLALSKGRKGDYELNASDVILNLVDRLLAEKEKNFLLQLQQLKQIQPVDDEKLNED